MNSGRTVGPTACQRFTDSKGKREWKGAESTKKGDRKGGSAFRKFEQVLSDSANAKLKTTGSIEVTGRFEAVGSGYWRAEPPEEVYITGGL